eukprot:Hpha_TRINITY_DN28003_c0_g1::TRINITY_DN28003_c0_g1_i1::g.42523::m.42523
MPSGFKSFLRFGGKKAGAQTAEPANVAGGEGGGAARPKGGEEQQAEKPQEALSWEEVRHLGHATEVWQGMLSETSPLARWKLAPAVARILAGWGEPVPGEDEKPLREATLRHVVGDMVGGATSVGRSLAHQLDEFTHAGPAEALAAARGSELPAAIALCQRLFLPPSPPAATQALASTGAAGGVARLIACAMGAQVPDAEAAAGLVRRGLKGL